MLSIHHVTCFVFRDGVGSGQYHVAAREAKSTCEAITNLYAENGVAKQANVTVVIVQKRVKTRMYLLSSETATDNPPAGTVMDHTVTLRYFYDFYLVPMNVNQGTVTPTHFVVVGETAGETGEMKPSALQRLSYTLTHM